MRAHLVRRELRARPARLAFVLVAVTAAVAFTSGAFGFSEQLGRMLTSSGSDDVGDVVPQGSVVLTARTGGLTTATALDDALAARVRSVDGVLAATGTYDQPVSFRLTEEQQPERPVQLRGLVMSATFETARWQVVAGRQPFGTDEVAVDAGGLAVSTAHLGDRVPLELPTGTRRVQIVGVVSAAVAPRGDTAGVPAASGESASPPTSPPGMDGRSAPAVDVARVALASAHVVMDPSAAPGLLGAVGKVDRIVVTPRPGLDPDALAARVRSQAPDGVRVIATTDRSASVQQTVGALDDGIRGATTAFAALTVLVAVLVVANVFGVLVGQRTRELGLLRALGASPAQVRRSVVGEGAAVGVVASVLGLALGVVLAMAGAAAVRSGNVRIGIAVTPAMVVAALAVGLGVSVAGAFLPAVRAGSVPPLSAMSDARAGAERAARPARAAVALLAGALLVGAGLRGDGSFTAPRLIALGAGVLLLLVGVAAGTRWVVRPLVGVAERASRWSGSVAVRLGLGNARRQPARTAAAASTLIVGLALVAAIGAIGASARVSIDRQFRSAGPADLYLERRGLVRVDTDSLLRHVGRATRWSAAAGAELVAVEGSLSGPGGSLSGTVASGLVRVAEMVDLDVVRGDPGDGADPFDGRGDGAPDGVMLSEPAAADLGVSTGDQVRLQSTSGRTTALRVVAVYRNTSIVGPAVVARAAARSVGAEGTFELAALKLREGVRVGRATWHIESLANDFPKVRVHDPEEFAALNTTVADTALGVVDVLLVGSLGIGYVGMAATLTLSVHERRRELVLLRALGASREQIRRSVAVEAVALAALAAVVGLGAGTVVGWSGSELASTDLLAGGVVPVARLVVVGVGSVLVGWCATLPVARRAGRVPPLPTD